MLCTSRTGSGLTWVSGRYEAHLLEEDGRGERTIPLPPGCGLGVGAGRVRSYRAGLSIAAGEDPGRLRSRRPWRYRYAFGGAKALRAHGPAVRHREHAGRGRHHRRGDRRALATRRAYAAAGERTE